MFTSRIRRLAVMAAAALFAGACGDPATAPRDPDRISLRIISGDNQIGPVGTELPLALVVQAVKSGGAAIPNMTVDFRVVGGGGTMYVVATSTNATGFARNYWTLGLSTADTQRVEVRAVLPAGGKQVVGVFNATALPGPAAQIAVQAGDSQTATVGTPVAIPPAVRVSDQYGNPVPGVAVTFAVATGGGSVTGANQTTNAGGIATVGSWTLGPASGANSLTATAAVGGIAGNPVTFTATATGDFWTAVTPMPTARAFMATGVISGLLYAAGGHAGNAIDVLEAYDPTGDSWTPLTPMPRAEFYLAAGVVGGRLYAVGGMNDNGASLATTYAYDPISNAWTTVASMPAARAALGVGVVDGVLYAVGGYDFGASWPHVFAYDPVGDTWSLRQSMPGGLHGMGVGVVNGILYTVGGVYYGSDVPWVFAYDPVANTWTAKASMPAPRSFLAVEVANDVLYAVGGYASGSPRSETFAYDPAADTWNSRASMSTQRGALGAGAIGGRLYAVGGRDPTGLAVPTVEVYIP